MTKPWQAIGVIIIVLAVVGIGGSIIYGIGAGISGDPFGIVGAISTALSIILAVASIWYGYVTNRDTQKVLEAIKDQNEKLVGKINKELSQDNFNDDNVTAIREQLSGSRESK